MPSSCVCALLAMVVATATLGAGCGGSSDSSGASGSGSATIDTWEVPTSIACGGQTSVTAQVRYVTSGASRRQLLVDGLKISGTDAASASLSVPVHCDALPHTFVLVVYDAQGHRAVSQKMLTTKL